MLQSSEIKQLKTALSVALYLYVIGHIFSFYPFEDTVECG